MTSVFFVSALCGFVDDHSGTEKIIAIHEKQEKQSP
jgi:hypothetical protein